jgi:hypothetical protein
VPESPHPQSVQDGMGPPEEDPVGMNGRVVGRGFGHQSFEMTMRYAHLSPDVRKDAVRLLDSVQVYGNLTATRAPSICNVLN